MPDSTPRVGGTFAPPLTDELLAKYEQAIANLDASPVADALRQLLNCCKIWWELPEPEGTARTPHPSGAGAVVSMSDDHKAALWDHIPWSANSNPGGVPGDLEMWGGWTDRVTGQHHPGLFDQIDPVRQKDLRNMAYHLLWFVRELDLDREPLTKDKL